MEDRIEVASSYGYDIELVYVDTPVAVCLWRNRLRGLNLSDGRVKQKIYEREQRLKSSGPTRGRRAERGNYYYRAGSRDFQHHGRRYDDDRDPHHNSSRLTRRGGRRRRHRRRRSYRNRSDDSRNSDDNFNNDGYGAREIPFNFGHFVPEEIILDKAEHTPHSFRRLRVNKDVGKVS